MLIKNILNLVISFSLCSVILVQNYDIYLILIKFCDKKTPNRKNSPKKESFLPGFNCGSKPQGEVPIE